MTVNTALKCIACIVFFSAPFLNTPNVASFAWVHSVSQSDVPCNTEIPFSLTNETGQENCIIRKLLLFFSNFNSIQTQQFMHSAFVSGL